MKFSDCLKMPQNKSPSRKDCIDHFILGYSLWLFPELEGQPVSFYDRLFKAISMVIEVF